MSNTITRRSILGALIAAPAIVRASSLMPIRPLALTPQYGFVSYLPGDVWHETAGPGRGLIHIHDGQLGWIENVRIVVDSKLPSTAERLNQSIFDRVMKRYSQ